MSVTASAYNSTVAQTDDNPNEGAWGDLITPGMQVVAVSPDLLDAGLARGTELQIEGLPGTWTVLDRTASRHRQRIDIYMGTDVDAAIKWGVKKVTIRWSTAPSSPSVSRRLASGDVKPRPSRRDQIDDTRSAPACRGRAATTGTPCRQRDGPPPALEPARADSR